MHADRRGNFRRHLTYANVMSTLAVFLVVAGGSAIAARVSVDSADVKNESLVSKDLKNGKAVDSSDVIDDALTGEDVDESSLGVVPSAASAESVGANSVGGGNVVDRSLGNSDIGFSSVTEAEVLNGSLRGDDIGDGQITLSKLSAGARDSCPAPSTARFGRICAGSPNSPRSLVNALGYCATLGLRLPSLSEAVTLARNYDVPGIADGVNDYFWTEEQFREDNNSGVPTIYGAVVGEDAGNVNAFAPRDDSHEVVCVAIPSNS